MNSNKPSENTLKLLLHCEVGGGQAYYEKFLSRFTWPGGASGPTIAIGIDCAYYNATELSKIFHFVTSEQLEAIKGAVGKTGERGKVYTKQLRESGITVSWEQALEIFNDITWPKFTSLAEKAFPGLSELRADAYGAIVSLVFNRGTSMSGDSRAEMRNIRDLIPNKNYKKIAAELRKMKRLWEGKHLDGLIERREMEACLAEKI